MNIYIYRFFTILFSPFIDIYILIRYLKGKEHKKRFKERFGYATVKRPAGKVVWFHAASVGEANSLFPVVKEFLNEYNQDKVTVLFTTGTITSAETIAKKIDGINVIHQFIPIDKYFCVKRFLKYWNPDMLLMVESEIWPNIVTMSHKIGCEVIIINAKMSERSLRRWKSKPTLKEQIFSCIDLCFPQSLDDDRRFLELGVQHRNFLGNLKFDVPPLVAKEETLKELKGETKDRKYIWCVASTHEKEEDIIGEVHLKLKKNYPNLLTIIVPRHINRAGEISTLLKNKYKLNVIQKSKEEDVQNNTDILLYDLFGEMGTIFTFSDIVLMAGSLMPGYGGHTPVEPAKLHCAILTGPYISNNKSLFEQLMKTDGTIIINDDGNLIENITNQVTELFNNPEKVSKLKENAYSAAMSANNITQKIVSIISKDFFEKE